MAGCSGKVAVALGVGEGQLAAKNATPIRSLDDLPSSIGAATGW